MVASILNQGTTQRSWQMNYERILKEKQMLFQDRGKTKKEMNYLVSCQQQKEYSDAAIIQQVHNNDANSFSSKC